MQLGLVAFDEVVGGGDEFWLELVGGLEEFVFGVGGALLAFGAAAAEEVLVAELGLADAEGVGGVDVFDEELVAFADGFEGADEELGLVEDDEEVGVAGVVGAADDVVEAEAEGDVVERAGEGDGVAVDLWLLLDLALSRWHLIMVVLTYVEEERPADRLEIDLLVLGLATILPRAVGKHIKVLPFPFLMLLDPLEGLSIHSRLELKNIKKALIFALRIRLQSSQQFDSSTDTMRKIRPSRDRDDLALILVLALPRLGLASFGAISDFAATSAGFGVDVDFRKA